jgi:hypothetical protein
MRRRAVLLVSLGALSGMLAEARILTVHGLRTAKGFSWATRRSAHFDFYVEIGTFAERDFDKIVARMEQSRTGLERLLGAPAGKRTAVFVVASRERMKALIGLEVNGYAIGGLSAMVYSETIKAIGAHETCHILARSLWGGSHGVWINEGLAVYSDDQWRGLPLHSIAKWLLDRDKLAPLKALVPDGWGRKYSDMITYPELGSFVKFVYENYGLQAVKTLWQRGAGGAEAALGKSLSQAEMEWRSELAKVDASSLQYAL